MSKIAQLAYKQIRESLSRSLSIQAGVVYQESSDYRIEVADQKDDVEIFKFLQKAYFDYVAKFKSFDLPPPTKIEHYTELNTLKDGVSLKVIDKDGTLIAIYINLLPKSRKEVTIPKIYEKWNHFFDFVKKDSGGTLDELEKTCMELGTGAVLPEWRNKGVATTLTNASINIAHTNGMNTFAQTVSEFSSNLLTKLNWENVYELPYTRYAKSNPHFKIPPKPDTHYRIFRKEIL